ncbi:MAG TPA: tetratricopeptide repeat protein [Acetobacteraceae bacterium]|nr:tetratricopeptide repeat protein [Acetobacteraceae bacterium]
MEETLREAIALHQQGRLAEAERAYVRILQQDPNKVDALHLLGMAALQTQRLERGLRLIEKVIRLNPNIASAHNNRGIALRDLDRFDEALASYDKALALEPDSEAACNNRGVALCALGRLDEALASYDRALALKPNYAEAHNNRANVLRDLGRPALALAGHDKAIALKPDHAEAHNDRGLTLRALGRPAEALAGHDKAIALRPDYAEAHNNRAAALRDLGRLDEALAACEKAIALRPNYAEAYNSRAVALRDLKRPEEALASCDRALALKSDYAEACNNRSIALLDLRRCAEAVAACDRALALDPRHAAAHYSKSMASLAAGDFATGWRLYEYRRQVWDISRYRAYPKPLWLGEEDPSGKTVFLTWEQGHGDTIQFCRYAPLLQARGARVVLSVQEPLLRLLRGLDPRIEVIGAHQEPAAFDLHCPLMSLPLAFGTTLETIPSAPRYLAPDRHLSPQWSARLPRGPRPRIGFGWSGYAHHPNDINRSMTLSDFEPLLSLDLDWVCLQKEFRAGEEAALKACPRVTILADALHDFADTAAAIDQLDLVVTVDTSIAHLACALGKPVWILLCFGPDWRWLMEGEKTAWYPTARLYRQPRFGDWPALVAEVKNALA